MQRNWKELLASDISDELDMAPPQGKTLSFVALFFETLGIMVVAIGAIYLRFFPVAPTNFIPSVWITSCSDSRYNKVKGSQEYIPLFYAASLAIPMALILIGELENCSFPKDYRDKKLTVGERIISGIPRFGRLSGLYILGVLLTSLCVDYTKLLVSSPRPYILSEYPSICNNLTDTGPPHDKVIVCYYGSWASFRLNKGEFTVDKIDPELCTHIIYSFAGLNVTSSTIRSLDTFLDLEEDYGKGSYKKLTSMVKNYPHLKVSIAIGGWNEGSQNYSQLAADPAKRKIFVESVVQFLQTHNFQGFDLDWEYPTKRGGLAEDKENFVNLVKELYEALNPKGFLLTAAFGAGRDTMESAYELKELNKYLDFVHLMCYDYHGKWDKKIGANAPLKTYNRNDYFTISYSLEFMLAKGIDKNKLVLGLALYGRTFVLKEEKLGRVTLGAPTEEGAFSGPYTREDGFMGYNEICMELKNNSEWEHTWDEETLTPFVKNKIQVISYDNVHSLKEKIKFAMDRDIAGVMVWSIDTDDFRGDCSINEAEKEHFPLLRSISYSIVESLQEIEIEKEKAIADAKTEMPNYDNPNSSSYISSSIVIVLAAYVLNSYLLY